MKPQKIIPLFLLLGATTLPAQTGAQSMPTMEETQPPTRSLSQTLMDIQQRIKKVELENGLTLIMMQRPYAPTVACYIKFKSGSADETDQTSGIAHMLEHMLFKGTAQVGVRDHEKEKKYLAVINRWSARRDGWRRHAEQARAKNDAAELKRAEENIQKIQKRLAAITQTAQKFLIRDEDNYLYSLHGQRGFNAYTSRDFTNYQVQLPSNRLEVWARIESDRIQNSVLRDFYTERDVVTEERRMRVDNVSRSLLFEQFLEKVYGPHPYARPVIGPMQSILYLNYEQALDYYRTYYAPNNTVIALVGDIDFAATEDLVRRYFGKMKRRTIPAVQNTDLPDSDKPLRFELQKKGSPVQIMSWFKPPMPDPADLHLEILAQILGGGPDSRMFQRLVARERIAAQVAAFSAYPGERYANMFLVYAIPAPDKTYDDVETAVFEEIERIKKDGVTEDELSRVVRNFQAELLYSLRSNSYLADQLSKYELITGDYGDIFKVYSRLDQIKLEDIQATAQKYLTLETVKTARLVPPKEETTPETEE